MGTVTMLRRPAKTALLAQMENIRQNFVLGLAAASLFNSEKALPILDGTTCIIGPYALGFSQVSTILRNPGDKGLLLKEFAKLQLRTLVRESLSAIETYCRCHRCVSQLERQPWYEFARIIDNCLAGNGRFVFDARDKAVLPVCWNDKVLTLDLQNQPLCFSRFSPADGWELFQEMNDFADRRLL